MTYLVATASPHRLSETLAGAEKIAAKLALEDHWYPVYITEIKSKVKPSVTITPYEPPTPKTRKPRAKK